jgi:hypothetical protein
MLDDDLRQMSMDEIDKRMKYKPGDFIPLAGMIYRGIRGARLTKKPQWEIEAILNPQTSKIPNPFEIKKSLFRGYQTVTTLLAYLGASILYYQ